MVVTANQSVVDRGRLPTHDVPVLWKRRRRAQQWRRRLTRIIQQTVDSESDSDSDSESEDELRNLYEQQQQRAQRLHRSLARKLARHATSYNMVCRPRVEFAQPKLVSPLAELTDYQMHETCRFNKAEFRMILSELTLLPRKVVTQFGCAASLELALYVLLRRWVCADRWEDIEKELRRRRSWLTDVYATTRSLLVEAYGCVVKELDFARIEPKLDEWDEIMIENSHDKLSTPGGLLFIDGKAKQDCMPGTGKAARRVARARARARAAARLGEAHGPQAARKESARAAVRGQGHVAHAGRHGGPAARHVRAGRRGRQARADEGVREGPEQARQLPARVQAGRRRVRPGEGEALRLRAAARGRPGAPLARWHEP